MRYLRIGRVAEKLGVSRTTIWRWERRGYLPPKRQIGPNIVGWLESEIEAFAKSRPLVRSEESRDVMTGP